MLSRLWPEGIATVFGAGHSPKAPGTVGSIAALPFVFAFSLMPDLAYFILTFALIVVGTLASESYGHGEDKQQIVIDEFVGVMITFFLVPHHWAVWILGFFLFRFFDILKPFPISYVEKKIKGGFGVMADDIVAGLFANALLIFVWLPYLHSFLF